MADLMESPALPREYEELLAYCPVLATDEEIVWTLDKRTLQILTSVARSGYKEKRERQRRGIDQAKAQGVQFGRPRVKVPENFESVVAAWESKEITFTEALDQCGLSASTFYRFLKRYRSAKQ